MKFKDGAVERIITGTLPPRPAHPGGIGCTGAVCVESQFAERESDTRSWA
jgi:hypothetical protein